MRTIKPEPKRVSSESGDGAIALMSHCATANLLDKEALLKQRWVSDFSD